MRQRIKTINTTSGIFVVEKKDIKGLFTMKDIAAVKVTTSGTREQIERKFASRVKRAQIEADKHINELTQMVHENHIKTKYFAA